MFPLHDRGVYISKLPSEQLTFFKPNWLKLTLHHLVEKSLLNIGFHTDWKCLRKNYYYNEETEDEIGGAWKHVYGRNAQRTFVGKSEGKAIPGRPKH